METDEAAAERIAQARRCYAEELRFYAHVTSEAVVRAFGAVPRERFLGSGPWHIVGYTLDGYWQTPDGDPCHLYHNVVVAIDRGRELNNGQPGFWAHLLDRVGLRAGDRVLHVGAGVGYYSAVVAEIVGPKGRVTALEIDPELAERARANLAERPNVEVLTRDGCIATPQPADAIIVNAGVTHLQPHWVDALPDGGRLLVPLTASEGAGGYLKVMRYGTALAAHFVCRVRIFPAESGRAAEAEERLREAFQRTGYRTAAKTVNSLRRDPHEADETCWLHGPDFCLSTAVACKEAHLASVRFDAG